MEDSRNSKNQVVLITGCSVGGIGNSLARSFASHGCQVVATSRSISSMSNLHQNPNFFLQELDILDENSISAVISTVLRRFGRLDILVNNAGIQCVAPLAEIPLPSIINTFNTNVFGCVRVIQAVIPHMASAKRGKIVNIGSVIALGPGPWTGAYSSSKAALHSLTDTLRMEVRHLGIHVVCVVPGAIRSNITRSAISDYDKNMPQWRFYGGFEGSMRERACFSQGDGSTSADDFSEKTVIVVLKDDPPAWFSYGKWSTLMAVVYHLPIFIKDLIFSRFMKYRA